MAQDKNEMDEMEKFLAEDMELEELEELEEKKKHRQETPKPATPSTPRAASTDVDETISEPKAELPPEPARTETVAAPVPAGAKENAPEVEEEVVAPTPTPVEDEHDPINQSIFALRTTANREDQVMDFITSNAQKHKYKVRSIIRPHGMRGYIFVEAASKLDAEQAAANIPYARGILPNPIKYKEIEHMLEQVKKEVDIRKNDIAEIISGPFKREQCKITRVDKLKEEVVVELLGAAVPIPITVKIDALKVVRRDSGGASEDSA